MGNNWFLFYNFRALQEHNDKIAVPKIELKSRKNITERIQRKVVKKWETWNFEKIEPLDTIILYDTYNGIVIGLFEALTKAQNMPDDDLFWANHRFINVRQLPNNYKSGEFFDFKKFIAENPLKSLQASDLVLEGKTYGFDGCYNLSNEDFLTIKNSMDNKWNRVLVEEEIGHKGTTGWRVDPDLICGFLDFYNSRATSFASLFLASVFGLIALSTINQSVAHGFTASTPPSLSLQIETGLSLVLFILVSLAGYYTVKCYSYYTGIADKIKELSIKSPYFADLDKIIYDHYPNGKLKIESLLRIIGGIDKKHTSSLPKRIAQKINIGYALMLALFLLGVFIYWDAIVYYLWPLLDSVF